MPHLITYCEDASADLNCWFRLVCLAPPLPAPVPLNPDDSHVSHLRLIVSWRV